MNLKTMLIFVSITLAFIGLPGMFEDLQTWRTVWLEDWEQNFILVGIGIGLLAYSMSGLWGRAFLPKKNTKAPWKAKSWKIGDIVKRFVQNINDTLKATIKWYTGLAESKEPLQIMFFIMTLPVVFSYLCC